MQKIQKSLLTQAASSEQVMHSSKILTIVYKSEYIHTKITWTAPITVQASKLKRKTKDKLISSLSKAAGIFPL